MASPAKALVDPVGVASALMKVPTFIPGMKAGIEASVPMAFLAPIYSHRFGVVTQANENRTIIPTVPVGLRGKEALTTSFQTFPPMYRERGQVSVVTVGQLFPPRAPG